MTKKFGQSVDCPKCGTRHFAECGFSQWVRKQKPLDSEWEGTVLSDTDFIVHKYCFRDSKSGMRDRLVQYMMLVEVKSHGAVWSKSQRDTLLSFDRVLRSVRRPNKRSHGQFQDNENVRVEFRYSEIAKAEVQIISYGVHLLAFDSHSPSTSRTIRWDQTLISEKDLVRVLAFELNPDTLHPLELRRHKKRKQPNRRFPSFEREIERDLWGSEAPA